MKKLTFIIIAILLFNIGFCRESFGNQNKIEYTYKKAETITLNDFLYNKEAPKNWEHLGINKNGDVIYKNKIIIDNNKTINSNTASESYLYLKILLVAEGAKPREGCDTSDTLKNGIYGLGCYTNEY